MALPVRVFYVAWINNEKESGEREVETRRERERRDNNIVSRLNGIN